ncbi:MULTISPECIES: flavodoxin [unclassified Oceanobacter]|uniref:flavodoxin n=1 Tax=unclassified Oceanobacter TaxID=2620260 RepID=UPI002735FBD4|nr:MULTISPECIES: flavodoxin [unclassified Oceanobacter]MDP2609915.1 flavodoxin [Oceanobacter sp. 1_MG-2023]MDP2613203.1 flavodoxin [Oceanobacter sp. 2_MG-2023]
MTNIRTGIIFGTDTGNTEDIAHRMADQLQQYNITAEVYNITEADPETFSNYDLLILGIPTWDFGGIQADWDDMEEILPQLDLSRPVVALYGLGDQFGYGDYFVDAMGWLHNHLQLSGARFAGYWPTTGYEFDASLATLADGKQFCGLAIDEDQQFDLTDDRVGRWISQVMSEYRQLADVVEAG